MTTYEVWNGSLVAGTTSVSTGLRTDSLVFTVTSTCQLTGIAYYVPAGETDLTGSDYTATLYTTTTGVSGTFITSQVGSGTFTAGAWNWIPLSGVTLNPGTTYVAVITSPDLLQFVHNYWSAGGPGDGGIISGPITVPDQAHAPGTVQQGNGGGSSFPASSTGSWYGIDIQVTTASPPAGAGLMDAVGIVL